VKTEAEHAVAGTTPAAGTCFGFAIHSTLPFRYLRSGTGPRLDVTAPSKPGPGPDDELVLDWQPPRRPFRAELYSDGASFRLWVDGTGWFGIDPAASTITVPEAADAVRLEERIWGIPALLCFVHRGDLPLHAAAVEVGGASVLLAGPGRFGKTTLAAAFAAAGHRVLSEDLSCLRLGDGAATVPGPAMIRTRADVASEVEVPHADQASGSDDRVHIALVRDARGDCSPVPLRAVVLLRSSEDGISAEPIAANEAIADLWALSSPTWRAPSPSGICRVRCASTRSRRRSPRSSI
jgi:hypothetical protein